MVKVTILEFLEELQSFKEIPEEILAKARVSSIDSTNCSDLRILIRDFTNGAYDDDIDLLVERGINILNLKP